MPARIKATIEGADVLAQRLRILPEEVSGPGLIGSANKGAEVIRSGIERRAPRGKGARKLKGRSIGHMADHIVAVITQLRKSRLEISIGPDKDHFYSHMVERGHRLVRVTNRYRKGKRTYRVIKELGTVPPHPFIRPGFDETQEEAQRVFAEELRRRLGL